MRLLFFERQTKPHNRKTKPTQQKAPFTNQTWQLNVCSRRSSSNDNSKLQKCFFFLFLFCNNHHHQLPWIIAFGYRKHVAVAPLVCLCVCVCFALFVVCLGVVVTKNQRALFSFTLKLFLKSLWVSESRSRFWVFLSLLRFFRITWVDMFICYWKYKYLKKTVFRSLLAMICVVFIVLRFEKEMLFVYCCIICCVASR